ncbi:hypothetical protein N9878_00355 [bacterium]|nr:hypothetical protein [bacterium]
MAEYDNRFDLDTPQGIDLASGIDGYILDDTKKSLNERYAQEHYSLTTPGSLESTDINAQGRHIAGKVGVLGRGTLAARAAIGAPGEGAGWECTEEDPSGPYPAGTFYRYDKAGGLGWVPAQFATGTVYATPAEVAAGTVEDKAINPASLRQVDSEYVSITSGTLDLTQTVATSYTYNIADFDGPDVVPAELRVLHIHCDATNETSDSLIYVTYPDGIERIIAGTESSGVIGDSGTLLVAAVPIKQAQRSSITIRMSRSGVGVTKFTIFGATQRTFEE